LAEVIRPQYRALVFGGAYGGQRISELAGLRGSRVDLDAGTVDVAANITEVQGRLHSGPPKTKASRRRSQPAGRRRRGAGRPSTGAGPTERLRVPGAGRRTAADQRGQHRVWLPATLAAGLPGLRIHRLRHTAVAL
jgi:integrase